MVRFSLEEEGNPVGKKRIRGGGSGDKVCGSASTKKDKKRRDEGEAVPERDEEEDMCVEEEEEEEEEEEKGGDDVDEGVIGEERGQSSGDGNVCVRLDPDILDCSICYEPLRPPIFQCQSGHVACSSCCSKLLNKCHLCSQSIGYNRCLILEKVIEAIKIECLYAKYGCRKAMSYADKDAHEETCIYAPCSCPVPTCTFCGSREMLSAHFITTHTFFCERFNYNQIFKVEFRMTDPFRALYGKDGHLFLLLNNSVANVGNALSMACFRPGSLKHEFWYELTTDKHNPISLQLKSSITDITEWKGVYPMKVFLLVPPDLCTPAGKIVVNVCIRKIKRASIK